MKSLSGIIRVSAFVLMVGLMVTVCGGCSAQQNLIIPDPAVPAGSILAALPAPVLGLPSVPKLHPIRAPHPKANRTGFLGQDLKSLKDSNGKIVSLVRLEFHPDFLLREKVEVYRMRYMSDGLEVVGFIVMPENLRSKYPVIIYNRGGNREFGKIGFPRLRYLSTFAAEGYVVVASQYRGNDGGEGKEEFGGSDVNDVLNLIPLVESLPFVFRNKILMLGSSRGGMMTYIAISRTDRIKAAAVVGGISDLFQTYSERPDMRLTLEELIGGTPEEKMEEYIKRSAYFWPEKINIPVLILHGKADDRVNVTQAEKLAAKLTELGKPHELVVYPGGDHGLFTHSSDRDNRILSWFAEHRQWKPWPFPAARLRQQ